MDRRSGGSGEGRRFVTELLERFYLAESAQKLVFTYSGRMSRKLDLAMTLVGNPRIIFLDEPTAGLDPRSRRTMWEIVRELVAGDVTVFLTTQYLDEADQLADRIAVLNQGRSIRSSASTYGGSPVTGSQSNRGLLKPSDSPGAPGSCRGVRSLFWHDWTEIIFGARGHEKG